LYTHEKKYTLTFILSGTVLFLGGVMFAYFMIFPMAFRYLLGFGGTVDKPMITIEEYISFFLTTTVIFGLPFELPLILVLLGMIGLIDQKFLRSKRRYAIVLIAVVAAVVTPPDPISMMVLLVPLLVLYEISIILVGVVGKRRQESLQNQP